MERILSSTVKKRQKNDFSKEIQVKHFNELSAREVFCLSRIRDDVFVAEQEITVPELDDQDLSAYHVFLLNEDQSNALAAARFFSEEGRFYIGRVAVQKTARHRGIASQLLGAIENYVLANSLTKELYLHAQASARDFYLASGYHDVGPVFMEAGIPHQMMAKSLA
ncbi:GNAT family N-acetyltransferase [Lactobacillus delbrueckii subsp. bulgaricus]|nr:GNAT family N-acetyltransferase [Lactobacillus delbrueckii subsp. bulgaricus]MBT9016107.1 GNAT family N-acetyltransferase [Lactobacillus delbrueckii subsp. bulgaricus]MBT9019344.1 GNAT family N-acetyltransferase [Lactobacillus delbrueckii subsp. bulgaricus]MBT9044738.1 GNAT family N-acetyltransferase [Lactobacillus delbrueckii subsp. bulgaricus]MBT9049425.1 GNAT family N-acetyltransferase [Lactobacillus delbrueckii subsp. bulgaricus]